VVVNLGGGGGGKGWVLRELGEVEPWVRGLAAECAARLTKVSRASFSSWKRSMLTEISRCHACSCQEIWRVDTTPGQDRAAHGRVARSLVVSW
jgi:hypothetical protein